MPRYEGNPDLAKFQFKPMDPSDPWSKNLQVKVGESLFNRVKAREDWQNWVRQVLQKALDAEDG
jgi:hypothetical protein